MDGDQNPIRDGDGRQRGLAALGAGIGDALESARWPFERLFWALRRRLVWPLKDRFATLGAPLRTGLLVGCAILVGAVGLAVAVNAGPGGSSPAGASAGVAAASAPASHAGLGKSPLPKPKPTLHGAAPVFKAPGGKSGIGPGEKLASTSGSAGPTGASGSATASSSAATEKISSKPASSTAAATTSAAAESEAIPGQPAGPQAIAVAREFSKAFVVYETGGVEPEVRQAFTKTATSQLSKALLKRPPRQPANTTVPKARVLNVVPGPSREGVYTLSVSLLRVGVTSELRLEMEKQKKKGWQVTNVLG